MVNSLIARDLSRSIWFDKGSNHTKHDFPIISIFRDGFRIPFVIYFYVYSKRKGSSPVRDLSCKANIFVCLDPHQN